MKRIALVIVYLFLFIGGFSQTKPADVFDRAQWITVSYAEPVTGKRAVPLFSKAIVYKGGIRSAKLYITALGLYQASVNGKVISEDLFTPGFTNYNKRLQYQVYDVGSLLQENNRLEVLVGEGWYRGVFRTGSDDAGRNRYGKDAGLLCALEIEYANGERERVVSDTSWKVRQSFIRWSELYDGECQDLGYQHRSGVSAALLNDSIVRPILAEAPEVRRHETFRPVSQWEINGRQLFDFGQNLAGWVRLRVKGRKGDTLTIRHAEQIGENGDLYTGNLRRAKAMDQYILTGEEMAVEPHFTYHGFRYASVEGVAIEAKQIEAVALYSDLRQTGSFSCSDTLLNQLHQNIEWSIRSNFFDIPTDCPQRSERMGWGADAQAIAPTANFLFDTKGFYSKWLRDYRTEQGVNGGLPNYAPTAGVYQPSAGGVAGWGDAITVVPYELYQAYGDTNVLREAYSSMKKWVDYIGSVADKDGLWTVPGYGDWYAPGGSKLDVVFSNQCYYARSVSIVMASAKVLGLRDEVKQYQLRLDAIRKAFTRKFGKPGSKTFPDLQTAYALAIAFELLPTKEVDAAVRLLVKRIAADRYHLTTGLLGTAVLLPVLAAHGEHIVAYQLLLQQEYPSWLYPVTEGATTIWERWDGINPKNGSFDPPSSFNHYALGSVGSWLYQHIAGIAPVAPGYARVRIAPVVGGGLTWAKGSLDTKYGNIVSEWKVEGEKVLLHVVIPDGMTAVVLVPGGEEKNVGAGTYDFIGQVNDKR